MCVMRLWTFHNLWRAVCNDPTARQDFKALRGARSPDDFDCPFSHAFERAPQVITGATIIGKDMGKPGKALANGRHDINGPVTVLNVGGMGKEADQETAGIGQNVTLAVLDLISRVIVRTPPLSVALMD